MDPLGKESCANKVKTKKGDTFTLVNILKDGPVILNNQKCCADFAIFAKRKGKNSVYVGNGSFVENKDFKIESENRGSFYIEYDQNTSEKWDVERTFLFDWRRENH